MALSKDREALLLTMSADIRGLQKSIDRMNGVTDGGFDRMEKRAQHAASVIERSFGNIKLPKSLANELNSFGADLGGGLRAASQTAQVALAGVSAYAIKVAADAQDINSAFTETFGDLATQGEAAAAKIADDFSRSIVDVKENMNTLQQVLKGLGVTSEEAFRATQALAARTIDLASNKNITDARAAQAILSGLTGETEALKSLGVVITEASVKAELLRLGFKGNVDQASEAAKATARLNLILAKTSFAQGDVARTSDAANNQFKKLQAQLKDSAVILGNLLLPAVVEVTKATTQAIEAFNDMPSGVQIAGLALLAFIAAGGPIAGLLANLGRVIDLANKTRAALIGVTGASAATGAAGVAGAAAAGRASLLAGATGAALTGTAIAGVVAQTSSSAPARLQAVLNERLKDEVAAREKIAELEAQSGAAAERKLKFWRNSLASLQEEIQALRAQERAESRSANRAAQRLKAAEKRKQGGDTSVATGFSLSQIDKVSGGARGKSLKATAVSGRRAAPIDESSLLIVDEKSIFDLVNSLTGSPITGNANPDGFQAAADMVDAAAEPLRRWQDETYQRTYDGIRGALEAASRDGAEGFAEYLGYAVRNRLLDTLADMLTNAVTKPGKGNSLLTAGAGLVKLLGFAGGGNPPVYRPYVVGENGPEIRVDRSPSTILPNSVLRALQGGIPTRPQPVTVNQFRLDLSGAVVTQDLLDQVNAMVARGSIQATAAARTFAKSDLGRKTRNIIP